MVKKNRILNNKEREELVRLIHEEGYTIKQAGVDLGIPYPNAKAVNKTYERERRTAKKPFRFRVKYAYKGKLIPRTQMPVQKDNPFERNFNEINRRTCGIKTTASSSSGSSMSFVFSHPSYSSEKIVLSTLAENISFNFVSQSQAELILPKHGLCHTISNKTELLAALNENQTSLFDFAYYSHRIQERFY